MEIRIENIENIKHAAKQFVENMGNSHVLLSTARWEPARQHSSRQYASVSE